jgi:hypothetical protein
MLVFALLGVLAVPASAGAAVETFHRFEAVATANYTVVEQCADGRTVQTRVTVIGGHEEESESGVTTLDKGLGAPTQLAQTKFSRPWRSPSEASGAQRSAAMAVWSS